MNDNFHEQLITKKQKGNPLVIRIIVVVFIILFLTIGALFLGFLSIIIAVVLGVTAYFYIFPILVLSMSIHWSTMNWISPQFTASQKEKNSALLISKKLR